MRAANYRGSSTIPSNTCCRDHRVVRRGLCSKHFSDRRHAAGSRKQIFYTWVKILADAVRMAVIGFSISLFVLEPSVGVIK